MAQLQKLKSKNSNLVILHSFLGSWRPEHVNLLRNDEQRASFNERITQFLVQNQIDGLGNEFLPFGGLRGTLFFHLTRYRLESESDRSDVIGRQILIGSLADGRSSLLGLRLFSEPPR